MLNYHIHTNSKYEKILLIFGVLVSFNVFSLGLSCSDKEINCFRFDYSSMDAFKKTVNIYTNKWSLSEPEIALLSLKKITVFNVNSLNESRLLIEFHPNLIFSFGQYIEKYNKPREWLFVAEQSFLRSFNQLGR